MYKRTFSSVAVAIVVTLFSQAAVVQGVLLEGRVFDGDVGDETKPIAGVIVELWGSNNPGVKEKFIRDTTTGPGGAYSLDASGAYEYFHIVEKDPPGYSSIGAATSGGTKIDNNWIQYKIPLSDKMLTGNNFWDKKPEQPPENHPPVANDDSASTNQDTPKNIDVLANDDDPDDDPLSIQSVSDPNHGTAVRDGLTVFYMPDSGFVGTDTFTYTIGDGRGGTATGRVTVTVIPIPPPEGYDYGDAPPPYPTLRADNGAQHTLATRFYLGTQIDAELDGQPNPATPGLGDDSNNIDDEDGVVFASSLIAGSPYQVTVTAPKEGVLDAWVDFNRDGDWADAGEQIFTKLTVPQGVNNLTFNVPATANKGESFARFRLSEGGVSSYTGPGGLGEVEDYRVEIDVPPEQWDFGDAPESGQTPSGGQFKYPTTLANNGARHKITTTGPWLGDLWRSDPLAGKPDAEDDGQPSPPGQGDDILPSGGGDDDENGVWGTALYRGVPCTVQVEVGAGGYVDAWIDFNGDGIWQEPKERIHQGFLAAGTHNLTVTAPAGSVIDSFVYIRFRINSKGSLGFSGPADDGEVEDMGITIREFDFGDAPAPYPTKQANNGAGNAKGLYITLLGSKVDGEADGQPDSQAMGDDKQDTDDEDGVTMPGVVIRGQSAAVMVNTYCDPFFVGGCLAGWIDFNGDGVWQDYPPEKIIDDCSLPAGAYTKTYAVQIPQTAKLGITYARFRVQQFGAPLPTGISFVPGEVEDYMVEIKEAPVAEEWDFGDAPAPYPDAWHELGGPYLGVIPPDAESATQSNPPGLGDDNNNIFDEDGVILLSDFCIGQMGGIRARSYSPKAGLTFAFWIDLNRDEDWDDRGELIWSWSTGSPGPSLGFGYGCIMGITVPSTVTPGTTYARFRVYEGSVPITAVSPAGPGGPGEVEDYRVEIVASGTGLPPGGIIFGWKYDDLSGKGLPGWTIWLDTNNDSIRDKTTVTDQYGNFIFTGLAPGTYTVGEVLQPGYTQTYPTGAGTHSVTITQGQSSFVGVDFRNRQTGGWPVGAFDFGDAPEGGPYRYPTMLPNGARHKITQRFYLGSDADGETNGIPSPDAQGDDNDNRNDEDGVLLPTGLFPGTKANITVTVTAAAPVDCYLDAWVDFNCDGGWQDPNEQIFTGKKLTALSNALTFDVPVDAVSGVSFARFRLSKNGGLSYDGEAPDGEVEDYPVEINPAGAQPPASRPPMGHPKWSQPPVEIGQDGGIPTYSGWNEPSGEVEVASAIWFDCWNCPTQCRGDADCDGDVDLTDLDKYMLWWKAFRYKYGDQYYDACADFDRDLDLDPDDFAVLENFFTGQNQPIQVQDCPGKPIFRQVLADDWLCKDDRPVTDIHWWCSFIGWTNQRRLPPVVPQGFHIGIWTNVAEGEDPQNPSFSHPGSLIWENVCDKWTWRFTGYDLDPRVEAGEKEACFEFTHLLSEDEWFKPDLDAPGRGKIYWLSITPLYEEAMSEVEHPWGWKTRPHFFADDAVRIFQSENAVAGAPQGEMYPISPPALGALWVSGEPITWGGESWDMAFELTSNLPDPDKPGRPDLNGDGIVDLNDFAIMARWWLTPDP